MVIELQGVSKSYRNRRGRTRAVDDLTVSIPEGGVDQLGVGHGPPPVLGRVGCVGAEGRPTGGLNLGVDLGNHAVAGHVGPRAAQQNSSAAGLPTPSGQQREVAQRHPEVVLQACVECPQQLPFSRDLGLLEAARGDEDLDPGAQARGLPARPCGELHALGGEASCGFEVSLPQGEQGQGIEHGLPRDVAELTVQQQRLLSHHPGHADVARSEH